MEKSGIGKLLFAKEFAKAILCIEENKICGNCKSCIEFDSSNHPDFVIVEPDGNNIKIEQIRSLTNKIKEKPVVSSKKVYIINDADKMTKEASNCLLKTLEEPPAYITIILIGENENLFLNTIRSRCTKIVFNKLEEEKIKKYIKENLGLDEVSSNILSVADGSIKKAIDLLENKELYNTIDKSFANIQKIDLIEFLKGKDILVKNKDNIYNILDYIAVVLFNNMKNNTTKTINYLNSIQIINSTKTRLKANSNFDMCIDYFLISVWEEINEKHNRN